MLDIRDATVDDLVEFSVLVKKFTREAKYPTKVNSKFIIDNFTPTINNPNYFFKVADDDGEVVGFLVGTISTNLFSPDVVGSELGWFILPEFRDGRTGLKMQRMFEDWCKEKNAKLIAMADIDPLQSLDKFYTRKGFILMEKTYVKEL